MKTIFPFFLIASLFCTLILSKAGNAQVPEIERLALIAIYDSTDGANWTDNTNWDSTEPVSTWYGVTVIDNHVSNIFLNFNALNGTLPSEIGNLVYLTGFKIINNADLSGEIPVEIGNLVNLIELNLSGNAFTGSIPDGIGNASSLMNLRMSHNELEDSVPASIWGLNQLTHIRFNSNNLVGNIPAEISNLTNLDHLDLSFNQFSGEIPSELGSLTSLNFIRFSVNSFEDSIPSELGNLIELTELSLSNNELIGPIPSSFENLVNLNYLSLGANQLTGTIPNQIWSLPNLITLLLSGNQLEGTLPNTVSNLGDIEQIWLNNNLLTGTVPPEFGNLGNLQILFLDNNSFEGTLPYELTYLSTLIKLGVSNNLIDSIPDFSGLSNMTDLWVQGNALEFDDLEPQISISNFLYSPQADIVGLPLIIITEGDQLSLEIPVGGEFNTYQWYKDGVVIDGATSDHYFLASTSASDAGAYTLEITNTLATELTLHTEVTMVDILIGIEDLSYTDNIKTYPNPVLNELNIDFSTFSFTQLEISIIDMSGRKYYSNDINSNQNLTIDVTELPSGVYSISFQNNEGSCTKRFMKVN